MEGNDDEKLMENAEKSDEKCDIASDDEDDFLRLIVSDSDNDEQEGSKPEEEKSDDAKSEDEEEEFGTKSKKNRSIRPIISDDSGEEDKPPATTIGQSKTAKLIDSDSSSPDDRESDRESPTKTKKKFTKKRSSRSSSNSGDSSDEENVEKPPKERPPKRMSAREAEEQMKTIQSVTQKLEREANVAVPYHRSKQFTLVEFLSRKNIKNPEQTMSEEMNCRSAAAVIKMTPEEMATYAKEIEERQKEAIIFFRGDDMAKEEEKSLETVESPVLDAVETPEPNETENVEEMAPGTIPETVREDEYDQIVNESAAMTEKMEERHKEKLLNPIDYDLVHFDAERPKLRGSNTDIIDLDSGEIVPQKLSGPDKLLQRYLQHTRKHHHSHHDEKMCLVSTETGKMEVNMVTVHTQDDDEIDLNARPGASLVKLKQTLESQLKAKKREEYMKRFEKNHYNGQDDEDEEEDEDNFEYDKQKLVDDDQDEKIADETEDIEEEKSINEQEMESDSVDENDVEDESDSSEMDEEVEENVKGGRIIRKFQDSDSENETEDHDIIPPTSIPAAFGSHLEDQSAVEDDLFELCSGRFEQTQGPPAPLFTQNQTQSNDELEMLCSGEFQTQIPEMADGDLLQPEATQNDSESQIKMANLMLESSDDEEKEKDEVGGQTKKRRRKRKFNIEDDEEDSDDEEEIADEEGENAKFEHAIIGNEEDEEELDHFVDYDSDENEIEVTVPKTERVKTAEKFFEQEAELSESEWGSADEDEKDMDNYELELGDEDDFDSNKIRGELEQIHMRKMLDQDAREIKKIQELLFEDEEKDGVGRERKFHWKNANGDFGIDPATNIGDVGGGGTASDEETEENWRKMRYDRDKTLQENNENSLTLESSLVASPSVSHENKKLVTTTIRKINIVKLRTGTTSNTVDLKTKAEANPFLIAKVQLKHQRTSGSFLMRDQETLNRLASLTKQTTEDGEPMAAIASKGNKFVFTALSPSITNGKRKLDEDVADVENKKKMVKNSNRKIF